MPGTERSLPLPDEPTLLDRALADFSALNRELSARCATLARENDEMRSLLARRPYRLLARVLRILGR
ncbi:hypothetical protein GCM10022200_13570 [Microbacterium awajiense]|uniref:Uncharacterized protein n=1 Tax=Microbacterium awajiense TaxID=415214 RepID=A0ABP7AGH9_9MICO